MNKGFQKAITNGINFLAKGQEKDGSFLCLVSSKFDDYKTARQSPAIVPTNIVLSSLAHIANKRADKIKQKAAKFLFGEKGEYWSFNYWLRKSDWYKIEPYPDDTDDTFCALAALYEYDPKLFDGEVMAKIVTMLTSCEEEEGGPYDMWLVPPDGRKVWNRMDLVCNANIAYFLSLQDIDLPKVATFIEKSIDKKAYEFPYNTIYPAIYFISRFYCGKKIGKIVNLLLSKQKSDGRWENPLRTALAISSLINLGGLAHSRQIEKGIEYLIKTQGQDGGWEPSSFYFSIKTKEKTLYAGSAFITTALCLEAINKFNKSQITNSPDSSDKVESPRQSRDEAIGDPRFHKMESGQITKLKRKESEIYDKVIENYRRRFSGLSKDFKEKAVKFSDRILKKHKDIALLPYYFANALGKRGEKISDELVGKLGTANLFGWIAYTIYDDFLDKPSSETSAAAKRQEVKPVEVLLPGEEVEPKELPLANVCLRESAEIFGTILPYATGFPAFSKKIFDIIDDANMWEVTRCRAQFPISSDFIESPRQGRDNFQFSNFSIPDYGDYSQLANKSMGHALGPIAILFALGYKENSAEVRNTMRFFRNYIIARQLNDDAHDWEDDLKKGQVNAVGARLLKDAGHENANFEKLREIFWHKTILGVCKDILRHTELAKKDLKKLSLIKEPGVFAEMLTAIERSAEEALKEREETMKFLKTYHSS